MSKNEKVIKDQAAAERREPPKSTAREYFESFVVTLVMAIFGMTFIVQAVTVPTGSMQNTILVGDYLLVNKFIYAPGGNPLPFLPQREVERGDIIVFKYPGYPDNVTKEEDPGGTPYKINFVKRVIGLPGDKVEFRDNNVYINDQILPEHRVIGEAPSRVAALETKDFEERQPEDTYSVYYDEAALKNTSFDKGIEFAASGKPVVVPADSFFVMGDSRNESLDSRYWGFVPRNLVIGRAMIVYWSCDRAASNDSFFGCLTSPRLDRIGKMIK